MSKARLLAGTAVVLVAAASQAFAQSNQQTAAAAEEIVVYGQGQTRQVQSVGAQEIEKVAPGTSPLQIIQKLPGVNYQAADPFGAYEWAVRISIRGFNQNQLGFTLDGVPLGDMSYGNHNGLHISRAVSAENIGNIEIAQGSGALDTASTSNLGGTLKFATRDPSQDFGVFTQFTGGTENTLRPFVRIETGELGTDGPRAMLSYGYSNVDKWKGDGKHKYHHLNGKIVQPFGEAELSAYFNYSDRREQDYQDLSLEMINRLGYDWDNLFPDYATALNLARRFQAGQSLPAPFATIDDAYFDASGLRKDKLGYISFDGPVSDNVEISAKVYGHDNKGQGSWITPYVPSPNGSPVSFRTTEYEINRIGALASATYAWESHDFNVGFWFEDNDFDQARRFYQMGTVSPERSVRNFQSNPFRTQFEFEFETKTRQFHIQDTYTYDDFTAFNFGFKSLRVTNTATPVVGTIAGTIKAKDHFLPQVGLTFRAPWDLQAFASYTENMRAFISAATGAAPFSTTQAGFDAIRNTLQPERSRTLEAGVRANYDAFNGVLAVYTVDFKNRLLVVSQGPGIIGAPNALSNVGSVSSKGVELGGTWNVTDTFSLFGSYAYNDAQYDDDTVDGAGRSTPTEGKRVVDAPKHLLKGELGYDDDTLFGKLGVSHTGKRFYTYLNDASVDSYTLVDVTLGYRFGANAGFAEGLEIQANFTNVLDEEYVSTIGSNGFGNTDPAGTFQTLQAGAPFQAFLTVRAQF
ncbi:MAG: TonB-dependent receptor [Rhodospirillaceae bacterium]|nr:TonB-dependent receptor [Rhodospirillaceae bacterium]